MRLSCGGAVSAGDAAVQKKHNQMLRRLKYESTPLRTCSKRTHATIYTHGRLESKAPAQKNVNSGENFHEGSTQPTDARFEESAGLSRDGKRGFCGLCGADFRTVWAVLDAVQHSRKTSQNSNLHMLRTAAGEFPGLIFGRPAVSRTLRLF